MSRPPEDIDPKAEDVAHKPRRRRHRVKPDPAPDLAAGKDQARQRALKRVSSPGVMFEPDGQGYVITSPHNDLDLWELQISDAFGTRSLSTMKTFVQSLKSLCSQAWDADNKAWKPNETELNAILAMVAEHRPRNAAEAALAAQAVAIHLITMRLASQALNRGGMVMERDAALTGKLARTYVRQIEALQALKGKPRTARQSIKVKKELHQHVHYHHHRGEEQSGGQPQDPKPAEDHPALPCPQQGGEVVRLPRRNRMGGV